MFKLKVSIIGQRRYAIAEFATEGQALAYVEKRKHGYAFEGVPGSPIPYGWDSLAEALGATDNQPAYT